MSLDIVILHGTMGSPEGNWFPWLKSQMEKKGHTVYIPTFPTPKDQTVEAWFTALKDQAPLLGHKTILIGHSCGATFIPHILESVKEPVKQAIMVSPFIKAIGNEEYDALNQTFYDHDFNWSIICDNALNIDIFHGDNDPYVPAEHAQMLSKELSAPLHMIKNGGHLNTEAGYVKFPELLEIIKNA